MVTVAVGVFIFTGCTVSNPWLRPTASQPAEPPEETSSVDLAGQVQTAVAATVAAQKNMLQTQQAGQSPLATLAPVKLQLTPTVISTPLSPTETSSSESAQKSTVIVPGTPVETSVATEALPTEIQPVTTVEVATVEVEPEAAIPQGINAMTHLSTTLVWQPVVFPTVTFDIPQYPVLPPGSPSQFIPQSPAAQYPYWPSYQYPLQTGSGFKVWGVNLAACAGGYSANYTIQNLAGCALESLSLSFIDLTSGWVIYGPFVSNAPFGYDDRECMVGGISRLEPGQVLVVGSSLNAPHLSGHSIRSTLRFCTHENMSGSCYQKTVEFVVP